VNAARTPLKVLVQRRRKEGAEVVLKSTKRDDLEGRGGREGKAETKGAQTLGPIL